MRTGNREQGSGNGSEISLAVTALAAWFVADRFGLGLLRKAWINLDVIWAAALILTGCLTLLV